MNMAWAWLAVSVVAMGRTFMHFHRLVPTVIADELIPTFQITAAELGLFAATFFYTYSLMQIPAGRLVDRYGQRPVNFAGLVVVGLATLMTVWAPSFGWAAFARLVAGIGASVLFATSVKRISEVFPARRFASVHGTMVGFQNLIGILIMLPMATIATAYGWRHLFFVTGLFALVLAVINLALGGPPKKSWSEDAGQNEAPVFVPMMAALKQIVSNPRTWPPFLISAGLYSPYLAFSGLWGVPWLMDSFQLTREGATGIMMVFSAGSLLVPPLSGIVADRLRSYRTPLVWGSGICLLAWMAMGIGLWLDVSLPVMIPILAVVGSFSLAHNPVYAVVKDANPPHLLGVASGVQNMSGFLGGMLLQPLLGLILDYFSQPDPATGLLIPTPTSYLAVTWVSVLVAAIAYAASLRIPHSAHPQARQRAYQSPSGPPSTRTTSPVI